jgi:hypothetical protein
MMKMKDKTSLPFVQVEGNRRDYWAPAAETGNWGEDNRIGRSYADALVAECEAGELGMMLSHVAQAITVKGRYGGIEVGFFNRLGEIASFAAVGARDLGQLRKAA